MKKKNTFLTTFLLFGFFILTVLDSNSFAQQAPTTGGAYGGGQFWRRGGNSNLGGGVGNIFGTQYNSPIYTIAGAGGANDYRIKLNGSFAGAQYAVGGYSTGMNRSGYQLLGYMGGFANAFLGANAGAYSLLHLNGRNGTFVQNGGYRPWMETGVTLTDNNDLSYMGIRRVALDVTETTIAWSDNSGIGSGPDQMVFRFTSGNAAISGAIANTVSSNLLAVNDLDGLHVARYSGTGLMGLGNTFGVGNPIYVQPQSLAHLSLSDNRDVWTQYTNRTTSVLGSGTGETSTDGFRVGIYSETTFASQGNGTALIYNQENRPILFSTNFSTDAVSSTSSNERLRIMNVSTPTVLPTGGLGVYNPAGLNPNFTRISISHNPFIPVTRPLSLLHLGYNTGIGSLVVGQTDGWRNWMDIGTFTTNGYDNMYVGLKNEGLDKFDAIINWGDNQTDSTGDGPDHLRFIFTSTTTALPPGQGDSVGMSNNGLEMARMVPIYDTTATEAWLIAMNLNGDSSHYGRVGIGDFTASGVNEEPTHKLDVIGNGRFRVLPDSLYAADSTVTKYVMVDSMGVLRWTTSVPIFIPCSDTVSGKLPYDSHFDLNTHNFYFEGQGPLGDDQVGVGYDCGDFMPGKLNVLVDTIGVSFGVWSYVDAENFNNVGGVFRTVNATNFNYGVQGSGSGGLNGYGGSFNGFGTSTAYGVFASAGTLPGGTAIGVYAAAGGGPNDYAGYFVGDVWSTTGVYGGPSDQNLKQNIDSLSRDSASFYINMLKPSTFEFQSANFPQLNLPTGHQYGLIAQDVELVLPAFIKDVNQPAQYDSLGNEISPALTYKGLDYEKFIPLLIADAQNKNIQIDSLIETVDTLETMVIQKDSLINAMNDRLTTLENCLSSILPFLCQINNDMIQQNSDETQMQINQMINVELTDENIVLEQNVPNPFAEQTVINYSVPATVQSAQIMFYNQSGMLIKTVNLTERGAGQITVYASDLSSGIYSYTLIADGVVVATKKMLKQ